MPTYDTHPDLGHPEVAGWVLGALDPPDAEAFGEHLASCSQCQRAVAEFEAVARAFRYPVPDAEPPPELEAKVLASVQHAVLTARRSDQAPTIQHAVLTTQPDRTPTVAGIQRPVLGDRRDEGTPEPPATPAKAAPARSARWWHWHWNARLLSLATAVAAVIAGAVFFGTQLFSSAAPAIAIPLHAQPGFTGSGLATPRHTDVGWSINLTVAHLKVLPSGQFYECWYAGPGNRPGHPNLITAGTFVVGQSGGGTFTMWSAADPAKFKIMQITAEQPGDAGQHGQVILSGSPKPPGARIS
jgi:hypothetical protein